MCGQKPEKKSQNKNTGKVRIGDMTYIVTVHFGKIPLVDIIKSNLTLKESKS